ncbi:RES family NAD+ phosphorylase [Gaopeijia maritima]|uniref:RES family NAD+ phosphorylase n=1 Tax=Gaopeijia maritima TaxID=3119007 RepID=UPI00386D6683
MTPDARLWRVFPWDPEARAGAPFSPGFVPEPTGRGRFDLPARLSGVVYLAESPAHALAEMIHPWRGRSIDDRHLTRAGRRLAVVPVVEGPASADLADLCDPATLQRLEVAPDEVASRLRERTQPIARRVWDSGAAGLRWWSRFWGDWHTTVLFVRRAEEESMRLVFGNPEPLAIDSPALREAADALGITLG